jgi:outer membrane protein assembly factor BamB
MYAYARFLLLSGALIWAANAAADWPQFRGPTGDGISEGTGLPVTWSETENIRWKVGIPGLGRSSPIVQGDRIWMTTAIKTRTADGKAPADAAEGTKAEAAPTAESLSLGVVCLDRASGTLLYHAEVLSSAKVEQIHPFNSYATPTPIIESDRLYADFGAYGTVCVDAATGRVLWKARLSVDHQLGPGSSPALCRDWLILVRDGIDAQYVAALDKRTGDQAWKTDRPPIEADGPAFKKSFSTPLVIEAGGPPQAVIPGPQWVVSYEPATGKEIWRVYHGKGYSIAPRPVYGHGMVYVCTGDFEPQLWAIRVDGKDDVSQTHVVWKVASRIPLMSSPILVSGELYVVSDNGVVSCLDALTGALVWQERIGGDFAASPVFADGRIYFFGRAGKTTIIRPGRTFVRVAENRLDGTVVASPAIAGGAFFIRTDTHLYCIQRGDQGSDRG